jgi:hypothetical protein
MPRRFVAIVVLSLACDRQPRTPPPPSAEFLLEAGDSTYWVKSGADGLRVRSSALVLARYDGRFYEVYVADDDHSFYDAVLVGQRLFRRDLITGDSTLVFDDPAVPRIAREYAAAHPSDVPLAGDEDGSDNPATSATTEIEVLDLHGPFVSFEYHSDFEIAGGEDRHLTRRGVIDLRSGQQTSVAALFGDSAARRILSRGRSLFLAALDSVLTARDKRARRAARALGEFEFDEESFGIAERGGEPAVVFTAAARGDEAGGLVLPLDAIPAPQTAWWDTIRDEFPRASVDSASDAWHRPALSVIAHYDTAAEFVHVTLSDNVGHEWPLAHAPLPARRLFWLDTPPLDSASRRALSKAFDESVLYSERARVARLDRDPTPCCVVRSVVHRPSRAEQARAHARGARSKAKYRPIAVGSRSQ